MMKTADTMSPAELHSAGATVRHHSPFADLPVPVSPVEMSDDLRQRFVIPFYRHIPHRTRDILHPLQQVFHEITPVIVNALLADFNWRSRITGALFVALRNAVEHQDDIGRLLLRSDVCWAARGYSLALARLNTPVAVQYMRDYLEYYLQRPDLWFDQADVMAALYYSDSINGTTYADELRPRWEVFVHDKPNWNLDRSRRIIVATMRGLYAAEEFLRGSR